MFVVDVVLFKGNNLISFLSSLKFFWFSSCFFDVLACVFLIYHRQKTRQRCSELFDGSGYFNAKKIHIFICTIKSTEHTPTEKKKVVDTINMVMITKEPAAVQVILTRSPVFGKQAADPFIRMKVIKFIAKRTSMSSARG